MVKASKKVLICLRAVLFVFLGGTGLRTCEEENFQMFCDKSRRIQIKSNR